MTALALNPSNEVRPLKVDANGNLLIAVSGGNSAIKSIQQTSITLNASAGGSLSNTATITAVNTAKTIILPAGSTLGGAAVTDLSIVLNSLVLTNATTVTATRTTSGVALTINFFVVEFN